jgi:hypothetical protein
MYIYPLTPANDKEVSFYLEQPISSWRRVVVVVVVIIIVFTQGPIRDYCLRIEYQLQMR